GARRAAGQQLLTRPRRVELVEDGQAVRLRAGLHVRHGPSRPTARGSGPPAQTPNSAAATAPLLWHAPTRWACATLAGRSPGRSPACGGRPPPVRVAAPALRLDAGAAGARASGWRWRSAGMT